MPKHISNIYVAGGRKVTGLTEKYLLFLILTQVQSFKDMAKFVSSVCMLSVGSISHNVLTVSEMNGY